MKIRGKIFLKKIVIFLLCIDILGMSCVESYAADVFDTLLGIEQGLEESITNTEKKDSDDPNETVEYTEEVKGNQELIGEIVQSEEVNQNDDDPQYGRENGYLDEKFGDNVSFLNGEEYIHNSKFSTYTINDVIDVSRYQGKIDWIKVKQSGIDYAIIRAGFRGYGVSGSINKDAKFEENIENAITAGVKAGVYFFSQAITQEEAVAEAEYVLSLIEKKNVTLPVVIDYEYASSSDGLTGRLYNANLTREEATNICKQFCTTVENAGYSAMVYANKDMLENRLDASDISRQYKVWLANYTSYTTYEGEYEFWQYTQNARVSGIDGNVDKSFWYVEAANTEGTQNIYNGQDYSTVFDIKYYIENNPEISQLFGDDEKKILEHFVEQGMSEGLQGKESFNVFTYKNRYPDLRMAYGKDLKQYYMHFIKYGEQEGRSGAGTSLVVKPLSVYKGVDYSPVYDYNYYVEKNEEVKKTYGDDDFGALEHFVEQGMSAGLQGKEDFNVNTYRNRYPDLRVAYGNNLKQYYLHFMQYGKQEGRSGAGTSLVIKAISVYNGIDYSLVYDFNYYVEKNEEVKKTYGDDDLGALKHFVEQGMSEGLQGKESFDVNIYKNRYSDLREVFGNDLEKYFQHYMEYGVNEGRSGRSRSELVGLTRYNGVDYSSVYDFNYYVENNEEVKSIYGDDDLAVLKHFIEQGMRAGLQGKEDFNVNTYKNRYPDLRAAYGKNLKQYYMHYIQYGKQEGRSGNGTSEFVGLTEYNGEDYSSVYDFNYYVEKNEDVKKFFGDDELAVLKHFINYGMSEGRQGNQYFNVNVYKKRYPDLRTAFGENLEKYYLHYMKLGKNEGRSAETIGKIETCSIVDGSRENITVRFNILLEKDVENFSEYYITENDLYSATIGSILTKKEVEPGDISIDVVIEGKENVNAALMDEFALAVKDVDGNLSLSSESVGISNPEAVAPNCNPIFKGNSKKGLQGIGYACYEGGNDITDARNANTKQSLINLDIASIVSQSPKSGYVSYTYKGKTYYFSELSDLKGNIQSLNYGYKQYLYGNDGRTPVAVTLCLLLRYNEENSFLIDPAARTPGHSYYMLNVREEKARETLEALFLYLGEIFGKEQCYVSNWVLGNEINSSRAWNYSGSMDFDNYVDCYATAFRILYNGVKAEKTGNTVCISLDNGWNAVPDTYAGKKVLDAFARSIYGKGSEIDWSIAYHAYSYPLSRADFWNDYENTTDSLATPYISMRNISVLTDYVGTLESNYGREKESIRVLLTEQGYSYSAGSDNQAMAIARGYYMAEFNSRIDAFIIRAIMDDPDEASGKLYFGLMNRRQEKRTAFYVYEFMDSDLNKFKNMSATEVVSPENYGKFNRAKEIVCNTNWSAVIPGFNSSKLACIK